MILTENLPLLKTLTTGIVEKELVVTAMLNNVQ